MPDAPEEIGILSYLPHMIRKFIINHIPRQIRYRLPLLRHRNIRIAAQQLGWQGKPLKNTFDMLEADMTLVNDLRDFYAGGRFPGTFKFTGPVFSLPLSSEVVDDSILKVFAADNSRPKIFCTLGSSGSREQLLEVVEVFASGAGLQWDAVILSPSSVCPIQDARKILGGRDGIILTDAFVPARLVNAMADIVVCHGGQGTIQTAIISGTPLVGLATQPEQQINLDHIAAFGAGIRIPRRKWKSVTIRQQISEVVKNKKFKAKALQLKELLNINNGKEISALAIWDFLRQRGLV
jgi:UDP:flavonoid glycosyltransferase YjiC (YdhE family)